MLYPSYVNRAKELGQQVITSVEHGFQGNYLRCWEAAKSNDLKFVFGAEAYWVPNRKEKDDSQRHLVLLAKTHDGIRQLNRALSTASIDGYYRVPRLDMELLYALNPNDVMVTSACVSYWGKIAKEDQQLRLFEDHEDLLEDMILHFGNSFFLEVQAHHTAWQKEVNSLCLDFANRYGVPLIAGLDSHYITEAQKQERIELRAECGIKFAEGDHEFSDGVFEDYPDEQTVYNRFLQQGILSPTQIKEAMDVTNQLLDFEDIEFSRDRKFATIYPELTQSQRNEMYLQHVRDAWKEYRKDVPRDQWPVYEAGIKEETQVVTSTNTSDYFLMDEAIFKLGREKYGGVVTPTGRGSGGGWFCNTLFGLSTLDRFSLPVTLYPSRFVTAERLKTGMPDIDMNVADPEPFVKAQKELLGEDHVYPFIAWGTLKTKSAFRMYARSQNLPIEVQDEVSAQIEAFEKAKKYAGEDEEVFIEDHVSTSNMPYITGSKVYKDIVVSASQAPCGYLLYNGDIPSEIGIVRVASETSGSSVLCTVIDGYTADAFGYIKNDILTVKVVEVNYNAMKRAGLPSYTSKQIIELTKNDPATWEIFAKGYTIGINQCEQPGAVEKLGTYKPTCLKDLAAFVAAIRPGFKSMVNKFLHRERFSYGIPSFDNLLKNDSTGSSWLIYQEDIMKCLNIASFPLDETYPIIKAISKKKAEKIASAEERFARDFAAYLMEQERISEELAKDNTKSVWQVILDASNYSFNAAHAVSVALDALYGAYMKAHYPYAYYAALLSMLQKKGDKDRIGKVKAEMLKAFGIKLIPCTFGLDNRDYATYEAENAISDSMRSIKFLSEQAAEALYAAGLDMWSSFTDLIHYLTNETPVNKKQILILIRLGYFKKFGGRKKLLAAYANYREGKTKVTKTLKEETILKRLAENREKEANLPDEDLPLEAIIADEIKYAGTPFTVEATAKDLYGIMDVSESRTVRITLYHVATGKTGVMKVNKKLWGSGSLVVGDVIHMEKWERKPAFAYNDGKMAPIPGKYDLWLSAYQKCAVVDEVA